MRELTPELALRMRRDRGLLLPTEDVEYTNSEVAAIAQRQSEIMKEMELLDKQLLQIAQNSR